MGKKGTQNTLPHRPGVTSRSGQDSRGGKTPGLRGGGSASARSLAKYAGEKPDLMIMDIRMPGKEGVETLNSILKHKPDFPVVLNTAYPECTENFMIWGAEACLMMVPDLWELKESIRRLINRKQKGPG